MVLLAGAGLMGRTLVELSRVNLGFNPANVLSLRVSFSGEHYKEPQMRIEFWEHVVAAVKALPGVEAASVSRGLPIGDWAGQFFTIQTHPGKAHEGRSNPIPSPLPLPSGARQTAQLGLDALLKFAQSRLPSRLLFGREGAFKRELAARALPPKRDRLLKQLGHR